MIRLVFASCLLIFLFSCSGIAGLAFTAASSAKSAYDGIAYADEKGWLDYKKGPIRENTWYQIHDDGIWFGDYFQYERRNYRIYGNPRDKEKYK